MKICKLWIHQSNFSTEELVINPKFFQDAKIGDILEIYDVEDTYCRLLLGIQSFKADFQQKDTISIEHSVANIFHLRPYRDVSVRRVSAEDVTVDMVELTIKDQYLSRGDMLKLKDTLFNTCVYVTKKVGFSVMRAQVNELWAKGEKVASGVIGENTRVVYRSTSGQFFIFIQMSGEMWDFDMNGDLYFEKLVNGFLTELFGKWKKFNCNHNVSIVLFSRTFYQGKIPDSLPEERKMNILTDATGRPYEDFYLPVTRNEKKDDWMSVIVPLKRHFNGYMKYIHCDTSEAFQGQNSNAQEGNFLEAINLSLNVFDRHNIDRNFDHTGQTVIIISPGSGMFEVDRVMNSITKTRILNSGVAVDLVCLSEQPLHEVPLLKFYKTHLVTCLGDDFNIPHWINHSYYRSKPHSSRITDTFIPRIKIPEALLQRRDSGLMKAGIYMKDFVPVMKNGKADSHVPSFVDYDAYDAQVFKLPKTNSKTSKHVQHRDHSNHRAGSMDDTTVYRKFSEGSKRPPSSQDDNFENGVVIPRPSSKSISETTAGRYATSVGADVKYDEILEDGVTSRFTVGSVGSTQQFPQSSQGPQRALINPFKPSYIPCKLTCNRHRWKWVFPIGPSGKTLQEHHHKIHSPVQSGELDPTCTKPGSAPKEVEEAAMAAVEVRKQAISEVSPSAKDHVMDEYEILSAESDTSPHDNHIEVTPVTKISTPSSARKRRVPSSLKLSRYLPGKPVDPDWTAGVTTSVDWKSLTLPACLPLMTDFSPDRKTLLNDYVEYNYELFIEDDEFIDSVKKDGDDDHQRGRRKMSSAEVFKELVSQRISQGFQLVVEKKKSPSMLFQDNRPLSQGIIPQGYALEEYSLSLGRIFHRLNFAFSQITVTRFLPRYPQLAQLISYKYNLWCSHRKTFNHAWSEFCIAELEKYNWNYLDQYICGVKDFSDLLESLKFWKVRFLLLPAPPQRQSSMGMEDADKSLELIRIEGFLKFIEALNRIRRPVVQRQLFSPKGSGLTAASFRSVNKSERRSTSLASPRHSVDLSTTSSPASQRSSTTGTSDGSSSPSLLDTSNISDTLPSPKAGEISPGGSDSGAANEPVVEVLSKTSPLTAIFEAMQDPSDGVHIIAEQKGLKAPFFLGAEATAWMMRNVKGVDGKEEAVVLGQKMIEQKMIIHASGSIRQSFVDGFYLYLILPQQTNTKKEKEKVEKTKGPSISSSAKDRLELEQLTNFRNEWMEVAIWRNGCFPSGMTNFLAPTLPIDETPLESPDMWRLAHSWTGRKRSGAFMQYQQDPLSIPTYKTVELDVDPQRKSPRPEWSTIRYHGNYCPSHAFSIELQWLVATGCLVIESLQSWARKANTCGFHLVPAPVSPFSDPDGSCVSLTKNMIFIPLNLVTLCPNQSHNPFEDFEPATHKVRLLMFQEAILRRFNFIRDYPYGETQSHHYNSTGDHHWRQHVHVTGTAFVEIVDANHSDNDPPPESTTGVKSYTYRTQSPYEISTQEHQLSFVPKETHGGFLWLGNYMLTKRWRTSATGELDFGVKLLTEFEDFCNNKDNALKEFWEFHQQAARGADSDNESVFTSEPVSNTTVNQTAPTNTSETTDPSAVSGNA